MITLLSNHVVHTSLVYPFSHVVNYTFLASRTYAEYSTIAR